MDATSVPLPPRIPRPWLRRWISLALLSLVCLIAFRYVREQRQLARNAQCRGRLGQIALALQNHEQETGSLPPLTVSDDRGSPLMSWRVRLLPYFAEREVYAELDLSEPWNSPKNLAVAKRSSSRIV